ncbi:MAG: hypothetical protein RIQ79_1456 [Verrucomicrobiota bacterium]
MDETPPQTPDNGLNKLDLSQLQSFSFGTSWVQEKQAPGGAPRPERERRDDRPRREGDAPPRRDRRDFKRPAAGPGQSPEGGGGQAPSFAPRGDRPAGPSPGVAPRGERPRFEGRGDPRGPRRDGSGAPGGPGGGRPDFRGPPREPAGPYISPYFGVTFYPEDQSFSALAQAIRKSCRTFELFYIAKSVVDKNDRFVAVVQRLDPSARPGDAAPAQPAAKAAPFFISVPDGVPFENEETAINHVMEKHLGSFFDVSDVEIDAPKGNFQVINRCPITGTLLAPPNYHRYLQILQQHHAANVRIPFEAYKARVESVREPELIAQWLEKMKKATRYTLKSKAPAVVTPAAAEPASPTEPASEAAPAAESAPAAEAPAAPAADAPVALYFDSLEDARQYLLNAAREKIVRSVEQLRFPGRILDTIPAGSELRRAVEGALERQRRFPLDTANALRGRLRRESFTIFKKGSKGISYVCAVKRRFRVPGQSFSDSLSALINLIEKHPMVKESELPEKLLGIAPRTAPVEGAEAVTYSAEEQAKLLKLKGDLRYLVKEGYVTEFVDGSLFTPAPMVESKKREIEATDVDPDNFPEAPAAKPVAAPEAKSEAPAASPEVTSTDTVADAAPAEAAPDAPETPPAA